MRAECCSCYIHIVHIVSIILETQKTRARIHTRTGAREHSVISCTASKERKVMETVVEPDTWLTPNLFERDRFVIVKSRFLVSMTAVCSG